MYMSALPTLQFGTAFSADFNDIWPWRDDVILAGINNLNNIIARDPAEKVKVTVVSKTTTCGSLT